jgi:hypothetical protein
MITNSVAILLLFVLFTGIGLLFPWSIFRKEPTFERLLASFWIGWAATIAFLQLWHLFYRIDGLVLVIAVVLSAAGWITARADLIRLVSSWNRIYTTALVGLAVFLALTLGNHVNNVEPHFDHGLYHQATVEWISNYAIVPGLGNLHHRLAFNNANLLYTAMIDSGILSQRGFYLSSTLLVFVLIVHCAAGFFHFFDPNSRRKKTHLYYALMAPTAILYSSTTYLAGYSPDIAVFVLHAVLAGEFLRLFDIGPDPAAARRQALLVVLLASVGIAVKLSFIGFGALILIFTLILWRLRYRLPLRSDLRTFTVWALVAGLLILPWMLRHVILSGYLLFPSTLISFPVPWRMPLALTSPIAPIITLWARTLSSTIEYTADLDWLLRWWRGIKLYIRIGLVTGAMIGTLCLLLASTLRKRLTWDWGPPALLAVSALGLVYWFFMAPDYRFSGAVIWIFLTAALLFAYDLLTTNRLVGSPVLLALTLLLTLTLWLSPVQFSHRFKWVTLLNPRPESVIASEAMRPQNLITKVTNSGLTVYMATAPSEQCWGVPLPCTRPQDFINRLSLIDPEKMQKGFYIHR